MAMNNNPSGRVSCAFPCARAGSGAVSLFVGDGPINSKESGAGSFIADAPVATDSDDACAGVGRSTLEYPVPNRSVEMNRRISAHELGHAFLARALGSKVHYVTILPGRGYEGRCVRSGPPSQLNLDENPEAETGEIVDVCSRLEKMSPEIGSGRVANAEFYVRAQSLAIELVGGRVCERVLFPTHTPLRAEHDQIEARAFATIACAAPQAASALIRYAEAEAECLIRENLYVVLALVDAIIDEGGTLTGERIDEIIAAATAREFLKIEVKRRSEWRSVEQSAANFAAGSVSSVRVCPQSDVKRTIAQSGGQVAV